jgi:hypothetical protein
MKGPGLRLLIDVRRAWKCPRCGYEERVGAEVTTVACPCCPGVNMKLIEEKRSFAEEFQKLLQRPRPAIDDATHADGSVAEEAGVPPVAETDSSFTPTEPLPGIAGSEAQTPTKRRGKRPHKQSAREQHRAQQQQASHSPDSPSDGEE